MENGGMWAQHSEPSWVQINQPQTDGWRIVTIPFFQDNTFISTPLFEVWESMAQHKTSLSYLNVFKSIQQDSYFTYQ